MKKLLLAVALLATYTVQAAPGDTTSVQAHSTIQMNHNGNFDTTIEFPDGSKTYRKVLMTFTLGKYMCPGSPQYCGDWDYTISNFLMTKTGDTVELGRFISPYANANYPRTPWSWTQRYVYDVTDFYTLLKDSATVRIQYSGYSWGFTGDINFEFIEGTPPRNVLGVERLWGGSFPYGKTPSINDRLASMNKTAPANTKYTELGFTVSGHGSDAAQCSEFCRKFYEVNLNNNKFDKTDIWRDDCGSNHIYPQSGTWVYNRGNWCPGDIVFTNTHKLAGVTGGSNYDIDVEFETYTSASGNASYIVQGTVFYYDAFNKSVDASLNDIIAPTDHETHFRSNPLIGGPVVEVQNTGSTTITSIKFKYSILGGSGDEEYTWTGSLASLETAKVEFPVFADLTKVTGSNNTFNVEIVEVNGSADEDATNNKMSSQFEAAPKFPNEIFVTLRTNNAPETSWKITKLSDNSTIASRNGSSPNSTYLDTVYFAPGAYRLEVTDNGCDGLSWWAKPSAGTGSFAINRFGSITPMQIKPYFSADFGCGFTYDFFTAWPEGVTDNSQVNTQLLAYPNPATDKIIVSLRGMDKVNGNLQVIDMTGRTVLAERITNTGLTFNTSEFANGLYTIIFYDNDQGGIKLQTRVLIAK